MTYPARIDGKPHFYPNEYIRVPPMGGARYLLKSQTWVQELHTATMPTGYLGRKEKKDGLQE